MWKKDLQITPNRNGEANVILDIFHTAILACLGLKQFFNFEERLGAQVYIGNPSLYSSEAGYNVNNSSFRTPSFSLHQMVQALER